VRAPNWLRLPRATVRRLPHTVSMMAMLVAAPASAADMIGVQHSHIVGTQDTLYSLARDSGLGITELVAANPGVDPWLPPVGEAIILPTAHLLPDGPRHGLVVNLADQRLYLFDPAADQVASFPIGIGHQATQTPRGETTVVGKRIKPTWFPPASIRRERPDLPAAVPPGPSNPLGAYALDLGWDNYVVHGTNRPDGIGLRLSHGCIRLRPEDIAQVFAQVPIGMSVRIIDQPIKVGRHDGELYVEVHPTQVQADQLIETGGFTFAGYDDLIVRVAAAAGDDAGLVDWRLVRTIADERRGIPVRVTKRPAT